METARRLPLCLSTIDGFEGLTARMPSADEIAQHGIPDGVPVLVMRRAGHEQLYRADEITVTIDTSPLPDPAGIIAMAVEILHHLAEDLDGAAGDVVMLARYLGRKPRGLAEFAAEMRLRRAEELAGAEVLADERATEVTQMVAKS